MKLTPIPDEAALLLTTKKKTMIVADLHIGIEAELREAGINIPSQTEKIASHLLDLCTQNKIEELVILGDVKHNVPLTSRQELYEIPLVFERVKKHVSEVHVTPGNHDGNLANILPKWVALHKSSGFVSKGAGFFHGQAWPSKDVMRCKHVVIAHEHPAVQFIETLGDIDYRQCWVKAKFNTETTQKYYPDSKPELIIIPAFNEFCGGTALNATPYKFLSPVLKNNLVDMDNAEIYLLDGAFLGKLEDLRV